MKKAVFTITLVCCWLIFWSPVFAAPEVPTMKPVAEKPMAAKPAPAMAAPVMEAPVKEPEVKADPKPAPKSEKKMGASEIVDLVFKILGGLVSLILSILGGLGYMKWAKSERFKKIQKYIDMAFPAVEALVKKTDNKVDDKLVEFLKMVNESLRKAGESELTDSETAAAKDEAAKRSLAEKLKG